jgi:hypothetical protein
MHASTVNGKSHNASYFSKNAVMPSAMVYVYLYARILHAYYFISFNKFEKYIYYTKRISAMPSNFEVFRSVIAKSVMFSLEKHSYKIICQILYLNFTGDIELIED